MKGVPGLLIALGLAIAGALCNWFYMAQKSRELDLVQFVAVADGGIREGDVIQAGQLIPVSIPLRYAQRLKEAAPPYADVATIVGMVAYRDFMEGEIMLTQDLRTPPGNDLKRDLGANEVAIWINVDSRGFVPQFLSGGDEVSFIVPAAGTRTSPVSEPGQAVQSTEVIGPFYILALGNRRGSSERARVAGQSSSAENVLAIRVKKISDTQLEDKAQLLLSRLKFSGNQALGLVMHSDRKAKGP
jgi:Flp pilus assembly protein CpaB